MRFSLPLSSTRHAVAGMLPKNKMRKQHLRRLRIFPGRVHDFEEEIGDREPLF
jgi:ribosomal protein L13